ncbi:hypothetical protein PFICI_00016 [Pestalotiopsis fici W106-1]|uniref:Uncharacterized protein n=1 Tax=Pestalotiopsis fici (strain W106-1 / CGMCC3.15140) TaxID=1229662 RepID=W3XJG1_PESFW|nr:uncharacterized protein PFICI_00016 [Pestalotiopsis fici W106-1]ETS86188.1 hypothetical protein PFICI_00016 [Pestalotiopsis fici W106-1]
MAHQFSSVLSGNFTQFECWMDNYWLGVLRLTDIHFMPMALNGFLFLYFLVALTLLLKKQLKATKHGPKWASSVSATPNFLPARYQKSHELVSAFSSLVAEDGAGAWPPVATHSCWPMALRPYKQVYLEMIQHLSVETPSLDDGVNRERCDNFRSLMRKLLAERITIVNVTKLMQQMENGNLEILPRDQINGFYCVIANCRHAYRWATIPVVKVAQNEKIVDFPPELEIPWPFLQRHFGVNADSGNNTANVLLNFDDAGERVYKINIGRSDVIRNSEDTFFRMFRDVEIMGYPIYKEMIGAVVSFEEDDQDSCLEHLKNITSLLRNLLKIFYERLSESHVSRSVWLSYIQGFQGWGVGRITNGNFVKYEGVSGNHVLFFQALDAFLGLPPYLKEDALVCYIPLRQRELCIAFRDHSFWPKVNDEDCRPIRDQLVKIIKHMKRFRTAHRSRVMPYLKEPAPERLTMTAGKGVLQGPSPDESLRQLDVMMVERLQQTSDLLTC